MYIDRVDDIQLRAIETWDYLGNIETQVREQSTMIRGLQVELAQQSDLMRQILARIPLPPEDGTTGPVFYHHLHTN